MPKNKKKCTHHLCELGVGIFARNRAKRIVSVSRNNRLCNLIGTSHHRADNYGSSVSKWNTFFIKQISLLCRNENDGMIPFLVQVPKHYMCFHIFYAGKNFTSQTHSKTDFKQLLSKKEKRKEMLVNLDALGNIIIHLMKVIRTENAHICDAFLYQKRNHHN